MPRPPKPWWRNDRQTWCVTIDGKRHNLGRDRRAAMQRFHELMARPKPTRALGDSVLALFDAFLEWCHRNRAPRTYEWYQQRLQWFADAIPKSLSVESLRPYHLQEWVNAHPSWSPGHVRGCITAVQRAFRWAEKLGYIDRNPIAYVEKPQYGTRDRVITVEEYRIILSHVNDEAFTDLLTAAWETGARPQELIRVEARHVELERSRWVFPKGEAKVKGRPRIVYLSQTALEITRRRMAMYPQGPLFRNSRGRPWKAFAINCRFARLKEKLGTRYCLYNFRHSFATRLRPADVAAVAAGSAAVEHFARRRRPAGGRGTPRCPPRGCGSARGRASCSISGQVL